MSQVLLGVHGLSYSWDQKSQVLSEISFELEKGQFTGLLGPNGSGKSTLMKAIAGILPQNRKFQSGQVKYLGDDFQLFSPQKRAQTLVYIGSDIRTEFPLTVEEVVSLGRVSHRGGWFRRLRNEDQDIIEWALNQCLCWNLRDRLIETLSGGERQLVALARGLAQGAKILLVDETLSQMDLNHQFVIGHMLKELAQNGWSILLVAHDVNLALEWIDSAILVKNGKKVAQGSVQEVIKPEFMSILYPGVELTIGKSPTNSVPKVFFGTPQATKNTN